MCLVTTQRKAKITKKDLVVFKGVREFDGEIRSLYHGFRYEENIPYARALKIERNPVEVVTVFDDIATTKYKPWKRDYEKSTKKAMNKIVTEISCGFHACLTKERVTDKDYIIREFIIPKGSEVYYDATGLIVSNQIILKPKTE